MSNLNSTSAAHPRVKAADLDSIARYFDSVDAVERSELTVGDRLIITTVNSTYTLDCLGDGRWRATGGWFDRNGPTPAIVRITGCSLGGSVINQKLIAGNGLRIEFDNRVVTTSIRRFSVWHLDQSNPN